MSDLAKDFFLQTNGDRACSFDLLDKRSDIPSSTHKRSSTHWNYCSSENKPGMSEALRERPSSVKAKTMTRILFNHGTCREPPEPNTDQQPVETEANPELDKKLSALLKLRLILSNHFRQQVLANSPTTTSSKQVALGQQPTNEEEQKQDTLENHHEHVYHNAIKIELYKQDLRPVMERSTTDNNCFAGTEQPSLFTPPKRGLTH